MRNTNFNITVKNSKTSFIHWVSAKSTDVSWIFINGAHKYGPLYFDTVERMVEMPFKAADILDIDIHDVGKDIVVQPINVKPNTRPLITWNHVGDAVRYKVYHKAYRGIETVIYNEAILKGVNQYKIKCPKKLNGRGGVWHFLRVEAVDTHGNESTRGAWSYFVMDVPNVLNSMNIVNGSASGLFDLSFL